MQGGEDARGARRGAAWGRPCRWTNEAVSLDNFGDMRGVARCAARELARVGKTGRKKLGRGRFWAIFALKW